MKDILIIALCFLSLSGTGQSHSDTQNFEVDTRSLSEFHLYNRNGNVKVKGVSGSVAKLSIKRSLKSSSSKKLEEAKTELRLDSMMVDDALYFYVRSEGHTFEIDDEGFGGYNSCCGWQSRDSRIEVTFNFDIELEIPKSLMLRVTTHRKDLEIEDFDGDLYAANHHGHLTAKRLGGNVILRNHHGDIRAAFIQNPTADCSYSTHHGDIAIEYQERLSALASFKTRHGEFYTEFDWSPEPVPVVKTASKRGTKYEVGGTTVVKINSGGPMQEFKTWHGDIYMNRPQ